MRNDRQSIDERIDAHIWIARAVRNDKRPIVIASTQCIRRSSLWVCHDVAADHASFLIRATLLTLRGPIREPDATKYQPKTAYCPIA